VYTPVPILNRRSVAADVIGGHAIPAGTHIIVSVWALHNDPAIWGPDVALFRPDRFLGEEAKRRHPWAFMPFSLGPRNCIGQNLAISEAKVILGTLLRHYRLSLPHAAAPTVDSYMIPVRPAERLDVIVTPRK